MERRTGAPRAGWHKTVTEQGLVYDAPGRGQGGADRPYWDESVHYVFAMDEILALEADVELLHSMCLEAVEHVVTTERYRDFALPEWSWEAVARVVAAAATRTSTAGSTCATTAAGRQAAGVQRGHPDHAAGGRRSCSGTG